MTPWVQTYKDDLWRWIVDCFEADIDSTKCEECAYKKACDKIWEVLDK